MPSLAGLWRQEMCHHYGNFLVSPELVTRDSSRLHVVDQLNLLCGRELRRGNGPIAVSRSSSGERVAMRWKTMVWLRTDHPDRYLIARCGTKNLMWEGAVVSSAPHRSEASINALNNLVINILHAEFDRYELLGILRQNP